MILPVVRRELRVQARSRAALFFRVGAAACGVLFATFIFALMTSASTPSSVGRMMFRTLSWIGLLFCLAEGPRAASGALSDEKRNGTLGLLFLTDLRSYDVVLGKLAATSLNSFYGLIGVFPALALPLLIGGVTGDEFWRLVLALAGTLFFSFAAALCASSMTRESMTSLALSFGILLFFTLLPPLLSALGWTDRLRFSPWNAFHGAPDLSYQGRPGYYWGALGQLWLLTLLVLLAACLLLRKLWNIENPPWLDRMLLRYGAGLRPPRWHAQRNPIQWLAARRGQSAFWCRAVAALVLLAGVGYVLLVPPTPSAGKWLVTGIISLHVVFCVWIAVLASQFLWRERESGALEILLCSPLTSVRIVDGFVQGMRWIFEFPLGVVLAVEAFLSCYLFSFRLAAVPFGLMVFVVIIGLGTVISDFYALGWYGLWSGLSSRKQGTAISKTVFFVFVLPLLFTGWCAVLWVGGAIVKNLAFAAFARSCLDAELRRRSTEPVAQRLWLWRRPDPSRLPRLIDE